MPDQVTTERAKEKAAQMEALGYPEAADMIEALAAERDEQASERSRYQSLYTRADEAYRDALARAEKAEAELAEANREVGDNRLEYEHLLSSARADRDRLAAIVERLPTIAGGAKALPGMRLWFWSPDFGDCPPEEIRAVLYGDGIGGVTDLDPCQAPLDCFYPTCEAAEAAANQSETPDHLKSDPANSSGLSAAAKGVGDG